MLHTARPLVQERAKAEAHLALEAHPHDGCRVLAARVAWQVRRRVLISADIQPTVRSLSTAEKTSPTCITRTSGQAAASLQLRSGLTDLSCINVCTCVHVGYISYGPGLLGTIRSRFIVEGHSDAGKGQLQTKISFSLLAKQ